MNLVNPSALFLLLPLAGVIIALYLLKMRRKDVRVPATFLWPAMTYEIRANSLFQRLKFSWLLLLQLLALAAIVLALVQPQFRQRGLGGAVTVLVVDVSASMAATDVKPSRFEEARRLTRTIIDSARAGDRLAIVEAGPVPRVAAALSADPSRLRSAVDRLQATDAEADVGEALRLASAITARQDGARIILLSDGVFGEISNFTAGSAELVWRKVGQAGENAAIAALGIADTPKGRDVFCAVRNFGKQVAQGILTLKADGKTFDSLKVEVAGGKTHGETSRVPAGAKVVEAFFDASDSLSADNYAATLADPGATLRILLVTRGNFFLERALALDPRVVLDKAPTVPSTGSWDVVVFDGVPEERVSARGVLTFGAAGPGSPVRSQGSLARPAFGSVEAHALTKAVSFDGVFIDVAQKVTPKPGAETVAEFRGGTPMIVAARHGAQRQVYVAFEPMKSDFPLQVAFPIFLSNTLDYLAPASSRSGAHAVAPGRTFALPAVEGRTMRIRGPDLDIRVEPSQGQVRVRGLPRVGVYDAGGQPVYVSLRSDLESNIAPVDQVLVGGKPVQGTSTTLRLADMWRPLALLALLVLAGEWWLFARRS